jgi:hypothetical protein
LKYDQPGHPWEARPGEWLAYVFLDDQLVNTELIRRGLGRFSHDWSPMRYVTEMRQAESEARDARRGLWDRIKEPAPPPPPPPVYDNYDWGGDQGYDDPGTDRGDNGGEVNVYRREYEREQ